MKKDKFVGICKVGEKGQIVIPKEARDMFTADAHCDTLYNQVVHSYKPEDCVVTFDRLLDGNVGLQTFAMFTSFRRPDPYKDGVAMKELYKTLSIPRLDGKLPEVPPAVPSAIQMILNRLEMVVEMFNAATTASPRVE